MGAILFDPSERRSSHFACKCIWLAVGFLNCSEEELVYTVQITSFKLLNYGYYSVIYLNRCHSFHLILMKKESW